MQSTAESRRAAYLADKMGRAEISPAGPFEAGAFVSLALTYTAGYFGIDDTGSLKIVMRFASDMGKPQFDAPGAVNYVTVEASNGAVLDVRYDAKLNTRPWDKTLYIKIVRGFLREGDRIVVRFGDPRGGSPGMRMQTFSETTFEFKVLVDAFAAYKYIELPESPHIEVVGGAPAVWKAILPTLRRAGQPFSLAIKAEDRWGNPTDKAGLTLALSSSAAIAGLPAQVQLRRGAFNVVVEALSLTETEHCTVHVADAATGAPLCTSNPLRVVRESEFVPYWADLHGQSEETIGTNSARELFVFARDRAFLDAASHQGNDFQITTPFWEHLQELTAEFNRDGQFVVFPGYEWSGNTGLGGDRNVLYMHEGRQIHRSSHALVPDLADEASDANSAADLFEALKDEDCVVFAHIGGRYADIKMAHDVRIERAVEVHSDWGTFEWLLVDALEQGYRVGVVSNSDGHKGRHGASYPGASLFGAYGGLTCILARELTRPALMDALRKRHHYGTTGSRMLLETRAVFDLPAERFSEDPNLGMASSVPASNAMMGDIVRSAAADVAFSIDVAAAAPIERIDIRNGLETIETFRPFGTELGARIRVIWEGSEYRGRGRETRWDGRATLHGNAFARVAAINFYNMDKQLLQESPTSVSWEALTTGGFGGFDAWLVHRSAGVLSIRTPLVTCDVPVSEIGGDDTIFDAGGIERRIRVFRLPDENPHIQVKLQRRIALRSSGDNALYVRVTTEDGHLAWSSPVYIFR
ncbi:MAG: DUF3604 domain-containing protein [Candidatus Velthaea sp.]